MNGIMNKKTKIVATLGPSTDKPDEVSAMIKAGANVFRVNMSHGDHKEHERRIRLVRKVSEELKKPIAILIDLAGPKIRIGDFETEEVVLEDNQTFSLVTKKIVGTSKKVHINYPKITREVKKGNIIFLNDGKLELQVTKVKTDEVETKVIRGGRIKGRRGVNIPGAHLSIRTITDKDKTDIAFGIKNNVDFMAISFVRKGSDVVELRKLRQGTNIHIISKIETGEALENLGEIINASHGIMIARGDLAVEVPAEEIPICQKRIIKECNALGKPVIVATQMMGSMVSAQMPTRAEVNDVANAILDGADAVMLSEESAIGDSPKKVVEMMSKVAKHTEKHLTYEEARIKGLLSAKDTASSVSFSVANVAHDLDVSCIVALSTSGMTAKRIRTYKPKTPILVLTSSVRTYHQMALIWGCYAQKIEAQKTIVGAIDKAKSAVLNNKLGKKNDRVIIAAGIPFDKRGNTNLLLVQRI